MLSLVVLSSLGLMLGASTPEALAPTVELVQTRSGRWVAQPFLPLVEDLERDEAWKLRFEEAVTTELRLPTGITFELTDRDLHARSETLAAAGRLAFGGESPTWLQFQLALSLDWARVGNVILARGHSGSEFANQQSASLLHYRWAAFDDFMQLLAADLARLRERTDEIIFLHITTGETFGVQPFIRVDSRVVLSSVADSGTRTQAVALRLHWTLPLPASAAQALERAPVIGEVSTMRTLDEALDLVAATVADLHRLPGRSSGVRAGPFGDNLSFDQYIPTAGGRNALFFLRMDRPAGETPWVCWSDFRIEYERARFVLDFSKRFADAHGQQLALAAVFPGADPSMRCTIVVATTPIYDHHLEARRARVLQFDIPVDASPIQVRRAVEAEVQCQESVGVYLWTATLKGGKTFSVEREYIHFCALGVTWPPEATFDGRAGVLVGGTTFTVSEPE